MGTFSVDSAKVRQQSIHSIGENVKTVKKVALRAVFVILIATIAILAGRITANLINPTPEKVVDNRYGAIVRLVQNDKTFCTGTVVARNLIITAAHCVLLETPFGMMMRPGLIQVRPAENTELYSTGQAIYASPQMDQAMIAGEFFQYKTKPYITDPEVLSKYRRQGAKFISCGFPLNGKLYCNETVFKEPSAFFWKVKGLLIPGMSGGPTMLPDGTVIAVNVAVEGPDSIISPIYNITRSLPGVK